MLRKGSRSTRRLLESPPIPSERYERRPWLCRVRCTCLSRIFLLFDKNGFMAGVRSLKVTTRHQTTGAPAMNTPLSQCHASLGAKQWAYSVQLAKHTRTVYIELHGSRQTVREGGREEARKDEGREGGREGGDGRGGEGRGGERRGREGNGREGRGGNGREGGEGR